MRDTEQSCPPNLVSNNKTVCYTVGVFFGKYTAAAADKFRSSFFLDFVIGINSSKVTKIPPKDSGLKPKCKILGGSKKNFTSNGLPVSSRLIIVILATFWKIPLYVGDLRKVRNLCKHVNPGPNRNGFEITVVWRTERHLATVFNHILQGHIKLIKVSQSFSVKHYYFLFLYTHTHMNKRTTVQQLRSRKTPKVSDSLQKGKLGYPNEQIWGSSGYDDVHW